MKREMEIINRKRSKKKLENTVGSSPLTQLQDDSDSNFATGDISLELEVTVSTQLLLNTPIQPIEVTEPRIIELCGDSEILQATLDNFLTLTNDDLRESTDFRTMNVVLASAGMSGIAIDELMVCYFSPLPTFIDCFDL